MNTDNSLKIQASPPSASSHGILLLLLLKRNQKELCLASTILEDMNCIVFKNEMQLCWTSSTLVLQAPFHSKEDNICLPIVQQNLC